MNEEAIADLLREAETLVGARRYAAARARYQAILDAHPTHATALSRAGVANCAEGRLDAGIRLLYRAVCAEPDSASHLRHLGTALLRRGQREWAVACLACAAEMAPEPPDEQGAAMLAAAVAATDPRCGGAEAFTTRCNKSRVASLIRREFPVGARLTLSPVRTLAGYCDEAGLLRREVVPERTVTIRGPDRHGVGLAGAPHRVRVDAACVAELPGGQLTHFPYLLAGPDDTVLSDLWAAPTHRGTDNAWHDDFIASLVLFSSRARRALLWRSGARQPGPVRECIALVERGETVWFNFLYQVAPKLMLVDAFPEYDRLPLLVGAHLPPQAMELLGMLNGKGREIVTLRSLADDDEEPEPTARLLLWLELGRRGRLLAPATYRFERLVVPSPMAVLRPYRRGEARADDHLIDPAGIEWLRATLLPRAERGPRRRIYLSRARQARRRLLDEAAVTALLGHCGFEVVYPEALSFRRQLDLFANAEAVVGLAGSAFSNMIFAPRGTKFVVIAGGNPYPVCQRAGLLGLIVRFLPAVSEGGAPAGADDDVAIDLQRLRALLTELGLDCAASLPPDPGRSRRPT